MSDTIPVENETALGPVGPNAYSWQVRMDVVARWMLLGNLRLVSELTNVPYNTLADWKRQDWWTDMVDQLRRQKKQKTADTLSKIVETGVDILQDRLANGDFVLNQKTGEIVRKPVGVKEAQIIVNQLIQRQNELEKMAEKHSHKQENIQDTLSLLAKEFQKINNRMAKESAQTIEYKETFSNDLSGNPIPRDS